VLPVLKNNIDKGIDDVIILGDVATVVGIVGRVL
jgi:hypothetical protein